MTPQELTAELAPIRVPEGFARFGVQDALVMASLGLVAGLILASLLRRITRPSPTPAVSARTQIAALTGADRAARLTGLAAILRRANRPFPKGLSAALYDPAAPLDPAAAERAALETLNRKPPP